MAAMDQWAVNAIVLHHLSRFFTAATMAGESLGASQGALASLLGNLSWAASPFYAKDREEQAAMAFGGALLGAFGPEVGERSAAVAEELGSLESAFLARQDLIVQAALRSLGEAGLLEASPAAVNEHVWKLLFPRLDYRQSLGDLVAQLRRSLAE